MGKGAYLRGARFERQLKQALTDKGFCVVRSSKSGVDGVSPDLVVLGSTKRFALECKAWQASSLHFDAKKIEIMQQWEQRAGIPYYIAWKRNHKEWRFFPLAALKQTPRGYTLNENDLDAGLTLEKLLS
ncbi:MAG: hypothetical protein ACP5O3_03920 [Candidatus Micrarchaeia archaeon]|jgi:Holliday junction resolvase